MNREGRVNLANKLTDLLRRKFGDNILLGGIYGSTVENVDTEYSDLELFFIVKNDPRAQSFSFAYEGMPVGVPVQKLVDVERDINEIDLTGH